MPRRRRHQSLLALVLAAAALLANGGSSAAHELVVADPGPVSVDLADASSSRLIHATLESATDTMQVRVAPTGTVEALLLVPVFDPEGSAEESDLPTARAEAGGRSRAFEPPVSDEVLLDDTTNVEYRVLGTTRIHARSVVRVETDHPTRAALLVRSPDEPFVTDDPDRVQRTLVKLRAWTEVSATGTRRAPRPPVSDGRAPAIFAAAIAVVALLLAAWWVRSGRMDSRRRGVERADAERSDEP